MRMKDISRPESAEVLGATSRLHSGVTTRDLPCAVRRVARPRLRLRWRKERGAEHAAYARPG